MISDIANYPKQFLFEPPLKNLEIQKPIKRVFFAAMGGSSFPADIINDNLKTEGKQIFLCRDYKLPQNLSENDLVIVGSYSGNTEETLTCFDQAQKMTTNLVAIGGGGKLKAACTNFNIPFIQLPKVAQPRLASGYFFVALMIILEKAGWLPSQKKCLLDISQHLENKKNQLAEKAKEMAPEIKNFIPIIYTCESHQSLARIVKIKMNENAKVPCFYNVVPELNHNEMVGYTQTLFNPCILFFFSPNMYIRNQKRISVFKSLLQDRLKIISYEIQANNLWTEIFEAIFFADYLTYFLADLYQVDPTPVALIEKFKAELVAKGT